MSEFKIHPYLKRDLARLYFPFSPSEATSVRNFCNLMKRNPQLMSELRATGYTPHTKILTPRQVRIIVTYLDTP